MKNLERTLKALGNRRRLAILKHLKENKEATVGEIADAINLSLKATSKHLTILSAIEIVDREQRSVNMFYYLSNHPAPTVRYVLSLL